MGKSKCGIIISTFLGFITLTFTFLLLTNGILLLDNQRQMHLVEMQTNEENDLIDEEQNQDDGEEQKELYLNVAEENWTLSENNETIISESGEEYLPIISINVANNNLSYAYTSCSISVISCQEKYDMYMVDAHIKVRGNSTSVYNKKPYRIKFDKKQTMLGLNNDLKAKSWVLLAEYIDSSLMKNATAFYLGRQILGEDGYYVSDYRFVEVFINNYYQGVYLLAEQQQVNSARIAITEPEKDYKGTDIGYLIEMDSYYGSEDKPFNITHEDLIDIYGNTISNFRFSGNYAVKSDIYSDEQMDFIQNYLQNIWNIMYNATQREAGDNSNYLTMNENYELVEDETISSAKEAIEKYVDINSLVDTFLLNEICINCDVGWSSFFMSVDLSENSKKLTFEAPWDFDISFDSVGNVNLNDFYTCKFSSTPHNYMNPWIVTISSQDWFMELVKEKWLEVLEGLIENAFSEIYRYKDTYDISFYRNFAIWGKINTNYVVGNYLYDTQKKAIDSLISVLKTRKKFLDRQFL